MLNSLFIISHHTLFNSVIVFLTVSVSFELTSYTVTEGDDGFAVLTLIRSGDLNRVTVVTVTTSDGSATGK